MTYVVTAVKLLARQSGRPATVSLRIRAAGIRSGNVKMTHFWSIR